MCGHGIVRNLVPTWRRDKMRHWLTVAVIAAVAMSAAAQAQQAPPYTVTAATVGTSSAQVIGSGNRWRLAIVNQSATANVACTIDGTAAALNRAGSFNIPANSTRVWVGPDSGFGAPGGAVNCISDTPSTPVTVEIN